MRPVKKNPYTLLIIIGASTLLVVFFAIHIAGAYHDLINIGGFDEHGINGINLLIDKTAVRLSSPVSFGWHEESPQVLTLIMVAWFLLVVSLTVNRRRFIHGREFGTARWAAPNELNDISAKATIKIEKRKLKKKFRKERKKERFIYPFLPPRNNKLGIFGIIIALLFIAAWSFITASIALQHISQFASWLSGLPGISNALALMPPDTAPLAPTIAAALTIAAISITFCKMSIFLIGKITRREKSSEAQLVSDLTKDMKKVHEKYETNEIKKAEYEQKENETRKTLATLSKNSADKLAKAKVLKESRKNAETILTATERACIYNLKINNNVLIIGGAGSGKTRGFVIPNILQANSSYIITDPKGEILEKSGAFLQKQGYDIRVLNLDDMETSDSYNPFNYLHIDRPGFEERVLLLIDTIIMNTDGDNKNSTLDPFWQKAERLFLQAIFFFTALATDPKKRNMNTVLELIGMLEIKEDKDDYNSDLDLYAEMFNRAYMEAEEGQTHIGYQQYKEFRSKAAGKTAKSIVIQAVARLAPFQVKGVKKLFEHDTMALNQVGKKKTAIFVVVPPTNKTFNFIAGMLFQQLMAELQYCATHNPNNTQKLDMPVSFVLDEFANTCVIPNFVQYLAYARSFGIGITIILQSLEQIKHMYKDEWGVIIDNCSARLFLGTVSHIDTLEYMSKMLGKGTFDKRTTGQSRGRSGGSSQNFDVIGRELLDPAELGKLPKNDCVLYIAGRNPFYSRKYSYENHKNYKYTSDADKANSYSHTPQPPVTTAVSPEVEHPPKTIKRKAKPEEIQFFKPNENSAQIYKDLYDGYYGRMDTVIVANTEVGFTDTPKEIFPQKTIPTLQKPGEITLEEDIGKIAAAYIKNMKSGNIAIVSNGMSHNQTSEIENKGGETIDYDEYSEDERKDEAIYSSDEMDKMYKKITDALSKLNAPQKTSGNPEKEDSIRQNKEVNN